MRFKNATKKLLINIVITFFIFGLWEAAVVVLENSFRLEKGLIISFCSSVIYPVIGIIISLPLFSIMYYTFFRKKVDSQKVNIISLTLLLTIIFSIQIGIYWHKKLDPHFSVFSSRNIRDNVILIITAIFIFLLSYLFSIYAIKLFNKINRRFIKASAIILILLPLLIVFLKPLIQGKKTAQKKLPNLIFISVDTLRFDHLSVYKLKNVKTPSIDRMANEGIFFDQMIIQKPQTLTSHASMFTGLFPSYHGARRNRIPLNKDVWTLAEIFNKKGYRTAAFVSGDTLSSKFGINRGFERYDDDFFPIPGFTKISAGDVVARCLEEFCDVSYASRKGDKTLNNILEWLDENHKEPFFLWLHLFDPHTLYLPPPPFDKMYYDENTSEESLVKSSQVKPYLHEYVKKYKTLERIRSMYKGEVSFSDKIVGQLIKKVKDLGIFENTIFVFVSDHGESLGEHNIYFEHGRVLYEDSIRVPFIIYNCKRFKTHKRIDSLVETVDVMPTILEIFNFYSELNFNGESLVPLIDGTRKKLKDFCVCESRYSSFCVRTKKWKYILFKNKKEELYNLKNDPHELKNVIDKEQQRAEEFKNILFAWLRKNFFKSEKNLNDIDRRTIRRLRSLGYTK